MRLRMAFSAETAVFQSIESDRTERNMNNECSPRNESDVHYSLFCSAVNINTEDNYYGNVQNNGVQKLQGL